MCIYCVKCDNVYPDFQKTTGMPMDEWEKVLGSGFRRQTGLHIYDPYVMLMQIRIRIFR